MPCNSDYMAQTGKEYQLQKAAQLLIYVKEELNQKVPKKLQVLAGTYYCTDQGQVVELCKILTSLDEETKDKIVYNAKDPTSRELADWWGEHLEADRKRIAAEQAEIKRKKLIEQAIAKLSPEELAAIKGR